MSSKKRIRLENNCDEWHFYTTPKISTYLFALCAGPFFYREKTGSVP
jgi:aminopeptidase N